MIRHEDFDASFLERQERIASCQQLWRLATTTTHKKTSVLLMPIDDTLSMRGLLESEIKTLETSCRCRSSDWSKLRLVLPTEKQDHDQSSVLRRHVSDTQLQDTVVLLLPTGSPQNGLQTTTNAATQKYSCLPMGLHSNLVVSNSIVDLTARIHRNGVVSSSFFGPGSIMLNCGSISCEKGENLGSLSLTVGAESGGGRELFVDLESTLIDVVEQMTKSHVQKTKPEYSPEKFNLNVFEQHSLVRDTPTLDSLYLYSHALIEGASRVEQAVLCPGAKICGTSSACNILLQWNSAIVDSSCVTDTLLMEEAQVGPQSIVASSILGPDVHVSAGEIHASVLGPNTAAHHQSLLIGVLWPLGRGNVGYGANVGSNHTGRLPDQECMAGEGTFWGLSTVIKFPVDLSHAPYTIVAAGTTMSPQRVTMPFSLIVAAQDSVMNDILPGWLLRSSPYTISRSEKKFASRRKAFRHRNYTGWKIIRSETVALCCDARAALENVVGSEYYDSNQIVGIGVCRLSERARKAGIEAYTACIQRYALHGLLSFVLKEKETQSMNQSLLAETLSSAPPRPPHLCSIENFTWNTFPWIDSKDEDASEWDFQRVLLSQEFPRGVSESLHEWLSGRLKHLVSLENDRAERIFQSKNRDDVRGSRTIPGYEDSHVLAEVDPVVCDAKANAQKVEELVMSLL